VDRSNSYLVRDNFASVCLETSTTPWTPTLRVFHSVSLFFLFYLLIVAYLISILVGIVDFSEEV
jgi:hypothetical protein